LWAHIEEGQLLQCFSFLCTKQSNELTAGLGLDSKSAKFSSKNITCVKNQPKLDVSNSLISNSNSNSLKEAKEEDSSLNKKRKHEEPNICESKPIEKTEREHHHSHSKQKDTQEIDSKRSDRHHRSPHHKGHSKSHQHTHRKPKLEDEVPNISTQQIKEPEIPQLVLEVIPKAESHSNEIKPIQENKQKISQGTNTIPSVESQEDKPNNSPVVSKPRKVVIIKREKPVRIEDKQNSSALETPNVITNQFIPKEDEKQPQVVIQTESGMTIVNPNSAQRSSRTVKINRTRLNKC